MTNIDQLRIRAYHEAGHAVMAYLAGEPVTTYSLNTEDTISSIPTTSQIFLEFEGEIADPWNYQLRKKIEAKVMIDLAGQIAEEKYIGKTQLPVYNDDYESVNMLSRIAESEEELQAYYDWLFIRTEKLISFGINWSLIKVVADELFENKELSGPQVIEIIETAQQDYIS